MSLPVILKGAQKAHANNALESLKKHGLYFDGSATGTGKTPSTFAIKQQLLQYHRQRLKQRHNKELEQLEPSQQRQQVQQQQKELDQLDVILLIVGPAGIRPDETIKKGVIPPSPWQRESIKYDEPFEFESYETLRGSEIAGQITKESPAKVESATGWLPDLPNFSRGEGEFTWLDNDEERKYESIYSDMSGMVHRVDTKTRSGKKYVYESTFTPTKSFMQFCADNIVFLVFDEGHSAKNDTTQNHSCAALIRAVRRARLIRKDGASYFAILSATPLARPLHGLTYFKLIGMTDPTIDDMIVGQGQRSIEDCYDEAREYDPKIAKKIGIEHNIINKRATQFTMKPDRELKVALDLWIECVLAHVQFVMIDTTIKQMYNGFFDIKDPKDRALMKKAHAILEQAKTLGKDAALAKIVEGSQLVEYAMVSTLVRVAWEYTLSVSETDKVILAFTYIKSVDRAIKELSKLYKGEIGRIAGDDEGGSKRSAKQRKLERIDTLDQFRVSDSMRALVMTKTSGATSIDLQDQVGQRKRKIYSPGDPSITVEQQLSGRGARFGTQSVPEIYLCYPKELGPSMLRTYKSNITDSEIMKRALQSGKKQHFTSNREKAEYKNFVKLPGEYDRYIELGPEHVHISYMTDSEIYDPNTGEPINPNSEYGWIETNNEEGRRKYRNTTYLINYLEKMARKNATEEDMPGIFFTLPLDNKYNPFPPDKYPTVTVLDPTP